MQCCDRTVSFFFFASTLSEAEIPKRIPQHVTGGRKKNSSHPQQILEGSKTGHPRARPNTGGVHGQLQLVLLNTLKKKEKGIQLTPSGDWSLRFRRRDCSPDKFLPGL